MVDVTPSVLLQAERPIPSHALVAFLAAGVGAVQLVAPKGTRGHRVLGWVFVIAMAYVALSAVFISTIRLWGLFSPIHLLIPVTLVSLGLGVMEARRGKVAQHKRTMTFLFVTALAVTGAFTFIPGRIMHQTVFGPVLAERGE